MASFECQGLDEMINQMRKLGQLDGPIVAEMLDAAAEIIRDGWKESAERHGHVDTGAMVNSIDFPVKGDARALYRDIYPQGNDAKGVSNAMKAFILHYGKSSKAGTYWVDEAERKAGPAAIAACQELWDSFLASGS